MAILDFPLNPQPGDQYTGDNGTTYIYDGSKWIGHASTLSLGTSALVNSGYVFQLGADGVLAFPGNSFGQFQIAPAITTYVTTSTPTVVFASSPYSIETMKATIQSLATGIVVGGVSTHHTQICEMLIVRKRIYDANVDATTNSVEAMVYGVVHTSLTPMATFDARWNATTSKIEITTTVDPAYTGVDVKVMATESVNLAP